MQVFCPCDGAVPQSYSCLQWCKVEVRMFSNSCVDDDVNWNNASATCSDGVICVWHCAQRQLPAVICCRRCLLNIEAEQVKVLHAFYLFLRLYEIAWPSCLSPSGLCQTVNFGLLRERRDLWQKCRAASRVQGPHPPWRGKLCAHQHAQERPSALCRQRTGW